MENYSCSAGNDDWLLTLAAMASSAKLTSLNQCVLVTVVQTQGSVPREAGCKMLILDNHCVGTIGGGHLELKVIEESRKLLADSGRAQRLTRIPLGPSLGQCCGGNVTVLFERLTLQNSIWIEALVTLQASRSQAIIVSPLVPDNEASRKHESDAKLVVTQLESFGSLGDIDQDNAAIEIARSLLIEPNAPLTKCQGNFLFDPLLGEEFHVLLFGAGHIGKEVINVMQSLPCGITWVDSRAEMFTNTSSGTNVRIVVNDEPADELECAPNDSYVIVMTHNHQLDLEICERALQQGNISFCGLIGSKTKRQRFQRRLGARGVSKDTLRKLTCPIGIQGVSDKHPALIAVAVVAQLLQTVERNKYQLRDNVATTG